MAKKLSKKETAIRESILASVCDIIPDFMYYDRKDDEDLSANDLKKALLAGVVSQEEILDLFKQELIENWPEH